MKLFFSSRGLVWLILLISFGFLYAERGGFSALFLFYTCALVGAQALLLMLLQSRRLQVVRSCSATYVAGDVIKVEVELSVAGSLPIFWLRVRDEWHDQWLFLGFKRAARYTYWIEDLHRGKYESKQLNIRNEDPLGLFRKYEQVTAPLAFVVLPKPSLWHMRHLLQHMASAEDLDELRDYKHGDALQRIHWKHSAKREDWVVRGTARSLANDWTVLLDGARTSWFEAGGDAGKHHMQSFERAVELAAYFVRKVSLKGACGILCKGSKRTALPVQRVNGVAEPLHMLASVQPDGEQSFADVLRREVPQLPVHTSVLCITSGLSVALARQIVKLCRSGYRIALIICQTATVDRGALAERRQALHMLHRSGVFVVQNDGPAKGGAAGA